jgi:hypothetical protein
MRSERSFTFVEVLLAAGLGVAVMVAVYSAALTAQNSYHRFEQSLEMQRNAALIVQRLQSDVRNAFIYSASDSGFQGSQQSIELCAVVNTTTSTGQRYQDARRILYMYADGALTRSVYRLNAAINADALLEKNTWTGVSSLAFEYAAPSDAAGELYAIMSSWSDVTEEQKKTLPMAVKAMIVLSRNDDKGKLVEQQIRFFAETFL